MNPMKLLFVLIISTIIITGCQNNIKKNHDLPKVVVITGQVINRSSNDPKSIAVIIDDVASSEQIRVVDDLDKDGRFKSRFERYYPQEVMVKYNTIYEIFLSPGDSIHIIIDAKKQGTLEDCFHSISFSGDAVEENEQLKKFQEWFDPIKVKKSMNLIAESRYDPARYFQYRDSLRNSYHQSMIEFEKKNKVSPSITTWIYNEIEEDFFYNMWLYPMIHRRFNNYPPTWDVPVSYYDFFNKANITLESLSNAKLTKPFALSYYFFYTRNKIQEDLMIKGLVKDTILSDGKHERLWKVNNDSIIIDGIKKYTPKGLLRQLVFNWFFGMKLRQDMNTDFFEKNSSLISQEIKEPFLVMPLQKNYHEIREIALNPKNNGKPLIIDSNSRPGGDILKQVVKTNRGKVIYIDCWATWCGPCLAEMPYSKKLMTELKDEPVSFVFLSFNSPKEAALKKVNDLNLGGIHYFLDMDESNHLQELLSFSSFPNYLLIDKNGNIVRSSSALIPSNEKTKNNIIKLINQEGK
jgi:thiol-disulfide isomerase/thioredoxin